MKLVFINCSYPFDIYDKLWLETKGSLQVPSDVFQKAIIDGLEENGIDYTLASVPSLPAWPRYNHIYTPEGEFRINGIQRGHYLSYCNLPGYKQISQRRVLYNYLRRWCNKQKYGEKLVALVYSPVVEMMGAAIDLKAEFPNLEVVPIVTDLIENAMDFKSNRNLLKRIQVYLENRGEHKLFPHVDKFVLLTDQMTEFIPEAEGRYIVVEGIASLNKKPKYKDEKDHQIRTLLYTGVLEEYAGIRDLVDAFKGIDNQNYRLIICGSGTDAGYVKNAATTDNRIIYLGRVDRSKAVELQEKATALINPRKPNGGITKYSFPSKTMEYMTSGTPMIGYHLEGIPQEYYAHMYTPLDLGLRALTECINYVLSQPLSELHQKAENSFNFIEESKNSKVQVKKIVNFIM